MKPKIGDKVTVSGSQATASFLWGAKGIITKIREARGEGKAQYDPEHYLVKFDSPVSMQRTDGSEMACCWLPLTGIINN